MTHVSQAIGYTLSIVGPAVGFIFYPELNETTAVNPAYFMMGSSLVGYVFIGYGNLMDKFGELEEKLLRGLPNYSSSRSLSEDILGK